VIQNKNVNIDWLILLLPLVGVIVGSTITIVGNLLMKRQERKAQAYKLITEKRIAAYENIIGIVKTASLAAVRIEDGERLSCPMIFLFGAKEYGSWFAHYVETTRNVTYLVDYKLNHRLLNFFNYLHYLEEYIKPLRGEKR
jgi:hypothetical protein